MSKVLNPYMVIAFLAFGCAQQLGPTGGPKDTVPPQILESEPLNFSTNFNGQKIKIRFDEFVQLKDFANQLVVSPPLKQLPDFRIKGKWLEIAFEDTLLANTTYNFQFGDGITDITEGNPLDSNVFVFSTGNKIDSLFVNGVVKNSFNLSPEKQVTVMLYSDFTDSVPLLSKPVYFSRTKDDGSFKIQFVKEGIYKIFALKDGNGNYLFDLPDEQVGFANTNVTAGDSAESAIMLFQEATAKQYLKRGYAEHFGKIVFAFALPTEKAKAVPLNRSFKKAWYIEELSEKKDTLIYWLTGTESSDTIKMQVFDGTAILDTVEIILSKREDMSSKIRGRGFPQKVMLNANANPTQTFGLYDSLQITATHPVKSYDAKKIILMEKTDTLKINMENTGNAMRKFTVHYKWMENTEYILFIPPDAFLDIYDLSNDTFQLNFKTKKKDDYGIINVKTDAPETNPQYIVQLMDETEKIIKEKSIKEKTTVKFERIPVAKYKLKIIYDSNKNSKWDTGNYLKKTQPEKTIYYPSSIELRPKFDLDLEWKIKH